MFLKLADWLAYNVFGLSADTNIGSTLHFFVYDTTKILFLLFFIILILSFLRGYIDNNKFKSFIEKQPRFAAHFLASLFGVITPFCSCSSVPLFIGFTEAGIPFGVSMSFLITSPMINELAILLLAGILGLKVSLIYVITGIIVGVIGGYLMELFGWQKYLQDYVINKQIDNSCCPCQSGCNKVITLKRRLQEALNYSKDLMKKIWLLVLLGVGIGSILHGYVPQEFFMQYLNADNILSIPLSVLVGIPLYADITTIIPIAQVLIEKGSAIGTVLVFMMSIAALSLPEMIILSRVMKKELIIRFLLFMFLVFTGVGYFYNLIL